MGIGASRASKAILKILKNLDLENNLK